MSLSSSWPRGLRNQLAQCRRFVRVLVNSRLKMGGTVTFGLRSMRCYLLCHKNKVRAPRGRSGVRACQSFYQPFSDHVNKQTSCSCVTEHLTLSSHSNSSRGRDQDASHFRISCLAQAVGKKLTFDEFSRFTCFLQVGPGKASLGDLEVSSVGYVKMPGP